LDLAEGFGFGEVALGKFAVELAHEEGGGGVVDEPEGGHDGFRAAEQEVVPDTRNFDAFFVYAAFSGFASAEDNEVRRSCFEW